MKSTPSDVEPPIRPSSPLSQRANRRRPKSRHLSIRRRPPRLERQARLWKRRSQIGWIYTRMATNISQWPIDGHAHRANGARTVRVREERRRTSRRDGRWRDEDRFADDRGIAMGCSSSRSRCGIQQRSLVVFPTSE